MDDSELFDIINKIVNKQDVWVIIVPFKSSEFAIKDVLSNKKYRIIRADNLYVLEGATQNKEMSKLVSNINIYLNLI